MVWDSMEILGIIRSSIVWCSRACFNIVWFSIVWLSMKSLFGSLVHTVRGFNAISLHRISVVCLVLFV